jgi:TatD DNase family protein
MIVDTHCHYNLNPLLDNWQHHWQAAQAKGVGQTVVVGTTIATSQKAVEQAQAEAGLFAAVGIHPNDWHDEQLGSVETVIEQLSTLINRPTEQKIVALGETGLDYFRLDKTSPEFETIRQTQQTSLRHHLRLAHQFNLPVILHVRDQEVPETPTPNNAYWDVARIVAELTQELGFIQTVLHCVSGPLAYHQAMVELGAYVGVAANATYKSADSIRRLALATPADRLVLETDAPFLPPQAYRGQTCEPWMIAETAQFVTALTTLSLDQLTNNAHRLFPQLAGSTVQ